MRQLFLSHATRDTALVNKVHDRLNAVGVNVYLAEYDNRAGENVHAKITKAIDQSAVVIVLLTTAGHQSIYVHQEIGYARSKKNLIVPVVTTEATSGGLGMLEGLEYIPLDEEDPDTALDNLEARVLDLMRKWQREDAIDAAVLVVVVAALIIALGDKA